MQDAALEIRRRLSDPVALVRMLGRDKGAVRQPRGLTIACVVHNERTASLSVTTGKDGTVRAKCFGCDWSGDALDLIAAVEGIDGERDFPRLLKRAADLAGIATDPAATTPGRRRWPMPRPPEPPTLDIEGGELRSVLSPLRDTSQAGRYLARRGLLAGAVRDDWRELDLGELRYVIDEHVGHGRDPMAASIGLAGLVRKRDESHGVCWSQHTLVIPWRDRAGRVRALQRRRLRAGEPKYVFANGGRPVAPYGIERLHAHAQELVFVEGAVDTLARRALEGKSDRVVLGIPGASGWRREWGKLGRDRVVIVALDADEAGDRTAQAIAEHAYEAGAREVLRSRPAGNAKDWAEQVAQEVPA